VDNAKINPLLNPLLKKVEQNIHFLKSGAKQLLGKV